MTEFLNKHKNRIIHELGSWITSALTFIAADGVHVLVAIYNGDYSSGTILTLRYLVLKSVIKAAFIKVFPQLFPLYKKDVGILPSDSGNP